MAKMTPEQAATAVDEMSDAGFSSDEIEAFLQDQGISPRSDPLAKSPGELGLQGTRTAAMIAGPIVGGIYGSALTAGRGALTQMAGETAGILGGDVTGRLVSGQPQNPKESLTTAATGGLIGGAFRGLTGIAGRLGNVPPLSVQEAGIPSNRAIPLPPLSKVTRALPRTAMQAEQGISAEATLADRARAASEKLLRRLTTERQTKLDIIKQASQSGVRIPIEPIKDALRSKMPLPEAMEMSDYRLLGNKINQAIRMLDKSAQGGTTISPAKVDDIITQVLRPKVYTGTGKPANTLFADAISEAERASTSLLNDALPGNVRGLNEAINARLDAAEKAANLFGEDRPGVINRLRTIHQPGNEDALKSLLVLAHEVDPKLAKEAMKLATRRAFAGDIRAPSEAGRGGFFGVEARTPLRMASQVAAPFQAFAGPVAAPFAGPAAYNFFLNQFNPDKPTQ